MFEQFLIAFGFANILIFVVAVWQSAYKNNPFGRCHLAVLGSFVWGDAVIFSLFWMTLSVVTLAFIPNIYFFIFCSSVFFAIRGFGETIYWLNQQFSNANKNPPKDFRLEKVFGGEAVWFSYQIIWQVITVVSIVVAVYSANKWLRF